MVDVLRSPDIRCTCVEENGHATQSEDGVRMKMRLVDDGGDGDPRSVQLAVAERSTPHPRTVEQKRRAEIFACTN